MLPRLPGHLPSAQRWGTIPRIWKMGSSPCRPRAFSQASGGAQQPPAGATLQRRGGDASLTSKGSESKGHSFPVPWWTGQFGGLFQTAPQGWPERRSLNCPQHSPVINIPFTAFYPFLVSLSPSPQSCFLRSPPKSTSYTGFLVSGSAVKDTVRHQPPP